MASEPESPALRVERAELLLTDAPATALRDAEAAARQAPSPRAWRVCARALAALGHREEALAVLHAAGDAGPETLELRFDLLRSLDRLEEAARDLEILARLGRRTSWIAPGDDPTARLAELDGVLIALALKRSGTAAREDAWPRFWRGQIECSLGRFYAAVLDFDRAASFEPEEPLFCLWRLYARVRAGQHRPALAEAAGLLRCAPAPGLRWQAEALRATALRALGRRRASAAAFSRALADHPASAACYAGRAEALSPAGGARSEEDLRLALDLDSGAIPALLLRAARRSRRGDALGARTDLEKARRAAPSDPRVAAADAALTRGRPAEDPGPPDAAAPQATWAPPTDGPLFPGGPRLARRKGRVLVDPRIELAGLLKRLAEPAPVPDWCRRRAPELGAFVDEATRRLGPFADADLLARFRRTAAARGNPDFPWLGVTQMMMGLSDAPRLEIRTPAWRDGDDLALLHRLRRFAERSRFAEFFASRERLFRSWTRNAAATVSREPYAEAVAEYVGVPVDAYYDVILSPLLDGVSLRAILRTDDGVRGARTVFCLLDSRERYETTVVAPSRPELLWTGWHELLHMTLDPWAAQYEEESRPLRKCYSTLPRLARRKDWLDCFSEHLVRAATQRLLRRRCGAAAQRALARADRDEGYRYVDALAAALAVYEKDRARYPTLLHFLPRWMTAWRP